MSYLKPKITPLRGLNGEWNRANIVGQGGKASGPLSDTLPVSLHLKTRFHGGRVSGPLNEAPSILSRVPSKTCLPCLGTLPPSFFPLFLRISTAWDGCLWFFCDRREKNFEKGVDSRSTNPYCCAPHVVWGRAFGRRSGTEKCLTQGSECPRLISPPRDEAL